MLITTLGQLDRFLKNARYSIKTWRSGSAHLWYARLKDLESGEEITTGEGSSLIEAITNAVKKSGKSA